MPKLKIGIVREGRIPVDRRVPLLPLQCIQVQQAYDVEIVVQPSDIRCITNKEYSALGIALSEDLSACDILLGIKEVPPHLLIPQKTFLFFSHTIKKQPHNRKLLQSALEKKITLIDYECLTDSSGGRIIAFGRFAGLVGAYNGLLMYGKKKKLYELKRAYRCFDLEEVKNQLDGIAVPDIKIAVTGSGRVAKGAIEILNYLKIPQISPEEYVHSPKGSACYTHLSSMAYHQRKDGKGSSQDFYAHPEQYVSTFSKYIAHTDLLIAAAYWHPQAPTLFTREQMQSEAFKIQVIADITCDIGGSIPSTIKPTTIYDPAYDYNPVKGEVEAPFSDARNITVMAIDNLPGELSRDASEDFGRQLIDHVLPHLLGQEYDEIIARATIASQGKLQSNFIYLEDYIK